MVVGPAAARSAASMRHGRRHGALLGLALGAGYIAQTLGLQHTPASVSGFITGLFVVFTPLCSAVLLPAGRTR